MGRRHRGEKKLSDREAEENLTAKLVETGYREELKKKVNLLIYDKMFCMEWNGNYNRILSIPFNHELRTPLTFQLVEKLEESGWKDQVKGVCKDVVKERGLDRITVEDLVQVISIHARAWLLGSLASYIFSLCTKSLPLPLYIPRKWRPKEVNLFLRKLEKSCLET